MTTLSHKNRIALLFIITAIGAFLRLYKLGTLPPGDGYDVAQYGVDALEILAGARPIFLASNFGREVLFSYWVALLFLITGPGTLGIQLAAALIGIATIPAVYWAAHELLFEQPPLIRTWGPLLAALVTAVSYWHINWSRVGLRVIWVPLFASLIVACLWYGLRTQRRAAFVTAGLLLGLSLYTYQAARLLPFLLLVAFGATAVTRRQFNRQLLTQFLLTAGFALLVFLPLGIYAWQNPAVFNDRLRQAVVFDDEQTTAQQLGAILSQSSAALLMVGIRGDNQPQFTIPLRPSLNPFLFAAFLAGLLITVWHWQRPSAFFLLAWLLIMFAPAMVASQAATAKRALGAFPAVAILIALGLMWPLSLFFNRLEAKENVKWAFRLLGLFVVGGLVVSTAVAFHDYFLIWGQEPGLPAHFERDHTEVGRYIGQLPRDETVFVSPFPVTHPAIQLHSGQHPEMRSYNGRFCQIYPGNSEISTTYVIVPGETEKSLDRLKTQFPQGTLDTGTQRPDKDEPYYDAYHIPAGVENTLTPQFPREALWQEQIRLFGFDFERKNYAPGEAITLTLFYEALTDLPANYTAFVHLLGEPHPVTGSPLWGQVDSEPCRGGLPTSEWQKGDIISDTVTLLIAPDAQVGTYALTTGFYTWPEIKRLIVFDTAREMKGDILTLTEVEIR